MPATGREVSENRPKRRTAASPTEIASYIGEMTAEMQRLAVGADLTILSDLLRQASEEARRCGNHEE